MFREITKEEALKSFETSPHKILMYDSKLKRMFDLKEMINSARFLVDEVIPSVVKDEPKPKVEPEDTSQQDISSIDLIHTYKNDVQVQVTETDPDCEQTEGNTDSSEAKSPDNSTKSKRTRVRTVDLGMLFALKRAGRSAQEIADEVGCSYNTAKNYMYNKKLETQVMEMQSRDKKYF